MTCIDDGILRAHLDGELADAELEEVNQHLASCGDCRARLEKLSTDAALSGDLLEALAPAKDDGGISAAMAYARFSSQFGPEERRATWMDRLFSPRWRPAWGLAAAAVLIVVLVGVSPLRSWAQRILSMLRVQKITVVSIDPNVLMSGDGPDTRPFRLINQFVSSSVVVTMEPGKPDVVPNVTEAARLLGHPVETIGSLGAPQRIEIHGETAFQMTIDRDRIETLLDDVGRSDIRVPESANGALIAVHIPKSALLMYGDCPLRHTYTSSNAQSQAEELAKRKMEYMQNLKDNCTYFVQASSPTISVPPDLKMSEIAEAALELGGMTPAEAHSFCQTVDWSSTMVVPVPRNTSSYETVTVDGVEGTLISETLRHGNRYSLVWIKNGVIHSLTGYGSPSDALNLAASLQ
jgi:hypothetical protein